MPPEPSRSADFVRGRDYERQVILRWLRTFWPNTAYEIANKIEALAHDQYAQSGWGRTDAV